MTGTEISLLLQIPIVGIFVFFVLKYSEAQRKTMVEQTQIFADTVDKIVKRLAEESTARDDVMRGYISQQRDADRGQLEQMTEVMRFFREELQLNNVAIGNNTAALKEIREEIKRARPAAGKVHKP